MGNEHSTPESFDAIRANAKQEARAKHLEEHAAERGAIPGQAFSPIDTSNDANVSSASPKLDHNHVQPMQATDIGDASPSAPPPKLTKHSFHDTTDPLQAFQARKHRHEGSVIEQAAMALEAAGPPTITNANYSRPSTNLATGDTDSKVFKLPKIAKRTSIASPQSSERIEERQTTALNFD